MIIWIIDNEKRFTIGSFLCKKIMRTLCLTTNNVQSPYIKRKRDLFIDVVFKDLVVFVIEKKCAKIGKCAKAVLREVMFFIDFIK